MHVVLLRSYQDRRARMNSLLRSSQWYYQRGKRNLGGSKTSPNAEVTLAAIRTPRVASRKRALRAASADARSVSAKWSRFHSICLLPRKRARLDRAPRRPYSLVTQRLVLHRTGRMGVHAPSFRRCTLPPLHSQ